MLIQRAFEDGVVPEEVAWATVDFLLKGKGGYEGIGLVEMVLKVCTAVVNCRLKRSVTLHDALHGFREGRDLEKATLEANLAQKLASITHKPLFRVLLDVLKMYDSLDRGKVHGDSEGVWYGTEHGTPNLPSLVQPHFCSQASRFLGTLFGTGRGVTQVSPVSPMIFNIVMEVVVKAVLEVICGTQ